MSHFGYIGHHLIVAMALTIYRFWLGDVTHGDISHDPRCWLHTLPFLALGFDYEDDEGEVQFRDGVQSAEITSLFSFTERWIHGGFNKKLIANTETGKRKQSKRQDGPVNTNEISMDTYMMSYDVF